MQTHFVIVGGGLAGASAMGMLRKVGFDGRISLVTEERHLPYIRPPLSKGFLQGKEDAASALVYPGDWYQDNDIDLVVERRVTGINRRDRTVSLSDGSALDYDRLLLATGSSPRPLGVPGSTLEGVHYLRTIDDSVALRERLQRGGQRVVLIGAGWISLEAGATARELGNSVTLLERGSIPLASAVGEELGTMFTDLHLEHGVMIWSNIAVTGIAGNEGRVSGVALSTGVVTPADVVVVGIGATPNVELAEQAGLEVSNGVLVDEQLRSSDPNIFAAGDIANAMHPVLGRRLRSEHWANAKAGGRVAARAMLGQAAVYDDIPYFYTDQYDLGMEYSGYGPLTAGARVVYRGNRESREFVAFWINNGRVVAGMNVNVWDVNDQVQRLIREARPVDVTRLIDANVPLEEL